MTSGNGDDPETEPVVEVTVSNLGGPTSTTRLHPGDERTYGSSTVSIRVEVLGDDDHEDDR